MHDISIYISLTFSFLSLLTVLSKNPVFSVLFLVLSFFNAAIILLLLNVELISILFIIIYVGAIAVLFLFVVMMLDVKIYPLSFFSLISFLIIINFIIFIFLFEFQLFFFEIFNNNNNNQTTPFNFDSRDNIQIYGQIFYNNFSVCFLLGGVLLLVAMIGAIILTLNFNKKGTAVPFKQLSKSTFLPHFI
jgi:NADH-quinone oxidoreductase subunit J